MVKQLKLTVWDEAMTGLAISIVGWPAESSSHSADLRREAHLPSKSGLDGGLNVFYNGRC